MRSPIRLQIYSAAISLILMASIATADASTSGRDSDAFCEARVHASICVVSPIRRLLRRRDVLRRPCLDGRNTFAETILDSYRRLPPSLKQRMCKLDRIFVERSFWASGYAHPRTNTIGIHQRMFEQQKFLSDWATWKEQLPFKLDDVGKHITAGQPIHLPRITVDAPGKPISSVFFIIVHELAHRIDMDRGLSRFPNSKFAKISWRMHKHYIKSAHLPPSWTVPCFYRCDGNKIPLTEIRNVYRDLQKGGFVSLYASRHPSEDFAETMTYYVLALQKDLQFRLSIGNTKLMDLQSMQNSPLIREKFDYMKELIPGS